MTKSGHRDYHIKEKYRKATEANVVCVNLWTPQLKILDKIIKHGYFHSRSELIRRLIDAYLDDYLHRMRMYDIITPQQIKEMGD